LVGEGDVGPVLAFRMKKRFILSLCDLTRHKTTVEKRSTFCHERKFFERWSRWFGMLGHSRPPLPATPVLASQIGIPEANDHHVLESMVVLL
jgi:hypothetical protein